MHSFHQPSVLCFRRWTRRRYSAFASLHKVVKISVVTFTCSLTQLSYQNLTAQTGDSLTHTRVIELSEVEITEDQPIVWAPLSRSIQLMERQEIAAAPARSIDDLLEQIPGVDVRQRGVGGIQADLSLRGSTFDQVLIFLNGVNMTDPQTGHHNLNLPLENEAITRLELIQGSAARIMGSQAFSGGILNIVTESPQRSAKNSLSFYSSAGSFGFLSASLGGNHRFASWQLKHHTSWKKSDGYLPNTDYAVFNGHFSLSGASTRMGKLRLQGGYQQKGFGANSFYSLDYPNQYEATKTLFASVNWEKSWKKTVLTGTLYERLHHDRFELFRGGENAAAWYSGPNYHLTLVAGSDWKLVHRNTWGKTTVGIDGRSEQIFSNVLGEPMTGSRPDFFDRYGVFSKEKKRSLARIFLEQTATFQRFACAAGISGNVHSDFLPILSGGMDATYDLTNNLHLLLGLNQSFRYPTFTDLYYKNAQQVSNPNLKPEFSTTYTTGIKFNGRRLNIYASGFYRKGTNIIDWVKYPDSSKWYSRNETEINAAGGDVQAEYQNLKGFIRQVTISWSALKMDKTAQQYDSKYALDYLRRKVSLQVEHTLLDHRKMGSLTAAWNLGWQDRAGTYTDFVTRALTPYRPVLLTDVRFIWKYKNLTLLSDVNNLMNRRIVDFGGLPQPGRSFRISASLTLPSSTR